MAGESREATAIKEALWAFAHEQMEIFKQTTLRPNRIGVNRSTWRRLDRAARVWLRYAVPYFVSDAAHLEVVDGLALLAIGGRHHMVAFRNCCGGIREPDWLHLEEDVHVPDDMVDLIYELPPFRYKTAGHLVDITPLLGEESTEARR